MTKYSCFLCLFLISSSLAVGQKPHPPITAESINNIKYVDGTKYTTVQACIDAVTNPGICLIPSNVASEPVWRPPPNYTLIEDTRFTNGLGFLANTIPGQKSHLYYEFHAGANDRYESADNPSGPIGLSINAFADAGGGLAASQANVVPLQIGAERSISSTRPIWGQDINVGCYNVTTTNALCTPLEVDAVNFGPADDATNNLVGIHEVADGTYHPGIGFAVTATHPGKNGFEIGELVGNYHLKGIQISNGDPGSLGLEFIPPDDTSAIELEGTSFAATTLAWYIENNGSVEFAHNSHAFHVNGTSGQVGIHDGLPAPNESLKVGTDGNHGVTIGSSNATNDGTANLFSSSPSAAQIAIVARGAAHQTADLFDCESSSGTVLCKFDSGGNLTTAGFAKAMAYKTAANCSSASSPARCGASAAGSVVVAASTVSLVINTMAVTANSQILLTFDASLGGKLGVTCNATFDQPYISARIPGNSFTVTLVSAPKANPACYSYAIIN